MEISKEANSGFTPLYIACYNRHIEVVKYLEEHGADINKEENEGTTLL